MQIHSVAFAISRQINK